MSPMAASAVLSLEKMLASESERPDDGRPT
jgi:hypothetical protein